MPTIRRASVGDADGVGRVHVSAMRAAYRGAMPDEWLDALDDRQQAERWRSDLASGGDPGVVRSQAGDAVLLVAEDDSGEVVGITAVGADRGRPERSVGELWMMNLAPAAWGRGVGPPLLRAAEDELRQLGFTEAVLWVLESNARARRFYERGGWMHDGAVKDEPRPGFLLHQVRYRRSL